MSSNIAFPDFYKSGFEDFAIPSYEVAPFTTIVNRAKVTRSLKAIAGIERVMVKSLNVLQNEFGPNGERVFEADNKDTRIRFVSAGGGWLSLSGTSGSYANPANTAIAGDYIEITFYGTGLNLLGGNSGSTYDFRASIDGGAEGANLYVTSTSSILSGRNYAPNTILAITSGLALGWHTAKIRNANTSNGLIVWGFEVLNQRTDLAVYSGSGISNGSSQGLSALATSAFNTGVVGTRGARVVKYVQNGVLSQAVREVDATSKYLTLADHTNEEVVRRINFREFGVNRADDFSTLTGVNSSRAFTLDDGTTTLIGSGVATSSANQIYLSTSASLTLTFVGTGLDFVRIDTANAAGTDVFTITVDGVSVGTLSGTGSTIERVQRVTSGLTYGTHTVKITRTTAPNTWDVGVTDFIIYQPKKPSLPNNVIEVADYNVMANFVANTTVTSNDQRDSGVLLKASSREATFVGTSTIGLDVSYPSGQDQRLTVNASYVQYTFFGTGFSYRYLSNTTYDPASTVLLNGVSLTTANFPTASAASYTGSTFNFTTGALAQSTANQAYSGYRVTGLPLGLYTLRMTRSSANFAVGDLNVITPIHINQPSLKAGSLSLKSLTKYSPEKSVSNTGPDLSKAKAWMVYDMVNQKMISSFNVSAVLKIATGRVFVYLDKPLKTSSVSVISNTVGIAANCNLDNLIGSGLGDIFTNGFGLTAANSSGVASDRLYITAVIYGELAEE